MNGTAFYARFIKCGSAKKGSWRFVRITKGDLWVSIWPSIVVGACLGCDLTLKRRSMLGELAPQVTPTLHTAEIETPNYRPVTIPSQGSTHPSSCSEEEGQTTVRVDRSL